MRKDDSVYLCHIIDSIERIEEYTEGMEKEDFSSNNLVQDGTIRQIEIVDIPVLKNEILVILDVLETER